MFIVLHMCKCHSVWTKATTDRVMKFRMVSVLLLHFVVLFLSLCALCLIHVVHLFPAKVFLFQLIVLELLPSLVINVFQVLRRLHSVTQHVVLNTFYTQGDMM